jgi:hypothetical protein
METQHDTIVAPATGPGSDSIDLGPAQVPGPTMSPLFAAPTGEAIDQGRRFEVSQIPTSAVGTSHEESVPSLAGSLSTFAVTEILSLLASATQTGELRVEGDSLDGRVWLDQGELSGATVGMTSTLVEAIFELACATDGWFYFSPWTASPDGGSTVAVEAVVEEILPRLEEWRELQATIPIDAKVALCPDAPHHDVQIRANQWPVLATIGTGGDTVAAVLDAVEVNSVVGLRILRELQTMGLIELIIPKGDPAPESDGRYGLPTDDVTTADNEVGPDGLATEDPLTQLHGSEPDGQQSEQPAKTTAWSDDAEMSVLAEVAVMPPPIVDDPWSRNETFGSDSDGVA